ncbi:MAG: hypothetical protein C0621_08245 [Desulfuromonas sp.]|nr:MAG: hypothetical protein C0621_08245 [Desulfuromonas sp.]
MIRRFIPTLYQAGQRFFLLTLMVALLPLSAQATDIFKIGIMQAQKGAAAKLRPLETYLNTHGVQVRFIPTASYTEAAEKFAAGEMDGMFSGSGVAGTMIIKKVAYPVLRPVDKAGISTYWAVVIAPKGAPPFDGTADYFKGKKVAFCALASSGEFFFRQVPGASKAAAETLIASSHQAAIDMVRDGKADVAIVKNRVWDGLTGKYPSLTQVGSDSGQNPNNALIISKKTDPEFVKSLVRILLPLEKDTRAGGMALKNEMGLSGYAITSVADFNHTLKLLGRAGVTPDFDFHF